MAVARARFVDRDHVAALPPMQGGATTLPSVLHDLLETAIIEGVFAPGDRIHADDIAAHYGVSRIPVREALRSLDEAGWVEIRPRYGVRVRQRTRAELDELFEFRVVVEGQVARWAAQRRTEEELAELRAALGPVPPSSAEHDVAVMAASARFYAVLRRAAHNSVLASTSAALEKRAKFYFSTATGAVGDAWLEGQGELCAEVAAADADAAARRAEQHMRSTGDVVRRLLFGTAAGS